METDLHRVIRSQELSDDQYVRRLVKISLRQRQLTLSL